MFRNVTPRIPPAADEVNPDAMRSNCRICLWITIPAGWLLWRYVRGMVTQHNIAWGRGAMIARLLEMSVNG
jgi:hypothetical protein